MFLEVVVCVRRRMLTLKETLTNLVSIVDLQLRLF